MTEQTFCLKLDPTRPIYAQIVEGLTQLVARGELAPGEGLPSVRALAERLRVNPNTVQRAYRELEQVGVVESRPGQGTFVRPDAGALAEVRNRLAAEIVARAVRELGALGLSGTEIEAQLAHGLRMSRGKDEAK